MKKITFLFFFAFFSWLGHAQLPVEDFDGTGWSLGATTDWWSHQNTVSLSQAWRQSNLAVSTIEIPYDPVNPTNPAGNCAFVNQQNGPDDHIVSDLDITTPASHEVMLLFDLNFPKKVSRSPRYF